MRVRLGADPSVLSGEAGRLFRLETGFSATPGAELEISLVEAARDDRLRDIICGGSMGKKSDGETRRGKKYKYIANISSRGLRVIVYHFEPISRCVTLRPQMDQY